jgi:transcriptional regulator with XRE-family HTH domain
MELIDAGKCLRLAQLQKNVSSAKLSRIIKTSKQQVLRWRRSKNMKLHTLQLLALSLDLSVSEFIEFNKN